ncbi:MAG: hypothetical protein F6K19_08585 [Cyanothece sp. SIO1E1]|nr:hypothetical protein [Cyanothece sp. SIO1E1]
MFPPRPQKDIEPKWLEDPQSEDEFNQRLKQLAIAAQQHPPNSLQRQLALTQLVNEIWHSGQLNHPQSGRWPPHIYQDLYHEALQQTCLYIFEKIENYRQDSPVMAWVNNLVSYKFQAAVKELSRHREITMPSVDDLDRKLLEQEKSQSQAIQSDSQLLRQFLQEDPEGLLRQEFIRGHSDMTFQYLAIARFIHDQTWEAISTSKGISVQTLCSFFNRRLRKFIPYFHKYLQH